MTRRLVFVDTWAWVAVAVDDDPDHARAVALYRELHRNGARLLTSRQVIVEAVTRLRFDVSHQAAVTVGTNLRQMQRADLLALVELDEPLWDAAWAWFRRYHDQTFSFVDCTSFAIMAAQGIQEALTADRHFATAGFTPLAT